MKKLIFIFFFIFITSCSNTKKVYWCGDHECINKKEKETYFKKTMIVEVREISKKEKKNKSQIELIKNQVKKQKENINEEKQQIKEQRLEEKRKIKEEKELAKQVILEEKKRKKEEKKLANKKLSKVRKIDAGSEIKSTSSDEKNVLSVGVSAINNSEFDQALERIFKRNMFRPYPNINDIPN